MGRSPKDKSVYNDEFMRGKTALAASNLARLMKEKHVTVDELAEQYPTKNGPGCDVSHIRGLLSGEKSFGPQVQKKLGELLGETHPSVWTYDPRLDKKKYDEPPATPEFVTNQDYLLKILDRIHKLAVVMKYDKRVDLALIIEGLIHIYAEKMPQVPEVARIVKEFQRPKLSPAERKAIRKQRAPWKVRRGGIYQVKK